MPDIKSLLDEHNNEGGWVVEGVTKEREGAQGVGGGSIVGGGEGKGRGVKSFLFYILFS